jgi:hypothetical protein
MPTLVSGVFPVSVNVKEYEVDDDPIMTEPKPCVVGVRVTVSVGEITATPVPVRLAVMDGEVAELEVTVSTPIAAPAIVGLNVRMIVQLVPGAIVAGQLLPPLALVVDSWNGPLTAITTLLMAVFPVFVKLKLMSAETEPTLTEPKSCAVGVSVTVVVAAAPVAISVE